MPLSRIMRAGEASCSSHQYYWLNVEAISVAKR